MPRASPCRPPAEEKPVDAGSRCLRLGCGRVGGGRVDLRDHAPRMRGEQRDPVADAQRLLDRMGDEQQGEAHVVPQLEQFVLHAPARQRVERGEGLVHQQDARMHGQRAGDRHALLHAAGELVRE